MGLRFRKSFKIMPGVRATVGLKGGSISIGGRGARVRVSTRGVYGSAGIPGTGLSYQAKLSGNNARKSSSNPQYRQISKRELQRAAKEERFRSVLQGFQLRLDKETGAVEILDSQFQPLSQTEKNYVWKNRADLLMEWLQQKCQEFNEDSEEIARIHEDMPGPDDILEYEFQDFPQPEPVYPAQPHTTPRPEARPFPTMSFWGKLFKNVRLNYEKKRAEQESKYQQDIEAWEHEQIAAKKAYEKAIQAYEEAKIVWQQTKADFMAEQLRLSQEFQQKMHNDLDFMAELFDDAIEELTWPRETLISYEIANHGQTIWLDIDLPEIEDLPQKTANIAAHGKRLNIKNKSQTQLRTEYAKHIHGILMRLAGIVFSTLPTSQEVIVSGYSQRLDKATGNVSDEYLLSIRIPRQTFSGINFENLEKIDPVQALDNYEMRRSMSKTFVFKAITPFAPNA